MAVVRVSYLRCLRLSDYEPLIGTQSLSPGPDGYDDLPLSSRDGDGSGDGDFDLGDGIHGLGLVRFDVLVIVAERHAGGRERGEGG